MPHNPLAQFAIKPIIEMDFFGFDISLTNASLVMILSTLLVIAVFSFVSANNSGIPSKFHIFSESLYSLIANMLDENIGEKGKKFVPFIFCLFLFILFCNLLGLLPYSYTATSQIAVTFFMAMLVFTVIVITGFMKQGLHFLEIFAPKGMPLWLAPLIIVIELFAFLARPVSLSLRLAANMIAGHVLLKVLAGFMVSLSLFLKVLPMPLIVAIIAFEVFVAILQAYIFAILSCVYLNDAINGH